MILSFLAGALLSAAGCLLVVLPRYRSAAAANARPDRTPSGDERSSPTPPVQPADPHSADEAAHQRTADLERKVRELESLIDILPVGVGIAHTPECMEIVPNAELTRMLGSSHAGNVALRPSTPDDPCQYRAFIDGKEAQPEEMPMRRAVVANKPLFNFEFRIVRSDGTALELITNALPLRGHDGAPRGCLATFLDVTLKNQTERSLLDFERKLQQTQKLESLGVLAGGIAHDFNNLLTGILGNANLAQMESDDPEQVGGYLAEIETASLRAAELCRQMLAYAGRGRFMTVPLNLNQAIGETVQLLKASISKRAVLIQDLGGTLPAIKADPSQVNQLIMNLVINASEALNDGEGTITVRTGSIVADRELLRATRFADDMPEGEYVYLEVADSGCGMSSDTQNHIFDPFFTTKFTGRGLGLSAVLGIVRANKGAITVSSELGRGTLFKVYFPAVNEPVPQASPPEPASAWTGSGSLLVIDDEEQVLTFVVACAEKMGFAVTTATDGAAGLALFEKDPGGFAAAVLDLTMPGLSGEQVYGRLRDLRPDLPIVMMSGYNKLKASPIISGDNLSGFIQKPFTIDGLAEELRLRIDAKR